MGSALHYCYGGLGDTILSLGVRSASPLYVDPSLAVNGLRNEFPRIIPFEALRTHQQESMGKTADQVSNRSTSNTTEQCHTKESQSLATSRSRVEYQPDTLNVNQREETELFIIGF